MPLASETALLYLEWTAANRERVNSLSHGRLGYIHLPDMGDAGIREFIKWRYPDIVVDQDLVAVLKGHDPQLERAVEELMKLLPRAPAGLPGRPAPPIKTEAPP